MSTPFLSELAWRGLLHQTAGAGLEEHLQVPGRVGYAGFDPTADSLTVGNLVPIVLLRHWQQAGHRPLLLTGGGTGLIGDPSGKEAERQLLDRERVAANVAAIRRILERLFDLDPRRGAIIADNLEWLGELRYIDVLRDVGKHFSVNAMIQRDSVRERLESREHGISYTEFSYMVLQAYDFLHLRRQYGCTVQMAGSDQYGNIVSGMDLIRRELGSEGQAFGITAPLVTRADGKKFGKTEAGAVWLSAERTSPYAFYQFWLNTADSEAIPYLKKFTFLGQEDIAAIEREQAAAPQKRLAQRALAESVTDLLHGAAERRRVEAASAALFGDAPLGSLDAATLGDVFADVPHSQHERRDLGGEGVSLIDLLATTTLASSKRQARELLGSGAVSVNGEPAGLERRVRLSDLLHGRTILLRRGRKHWHATRWID